MSWIEGKSYGSCGHEVALDDIKHFPIVDYDKEGKGGLTYLATCPKCFEDWSKKEIREGLKMEKKMGLNVGPDKPDSGLQEAIDLIGSIHNDCEIFGILVSQHREDLCYTVAEDLFQKAQTLVDDFCVED